MAWVDCRRLAAFFVENEITRRFINLSDILVAAMMKYLQEVSKDVTNVISNILPDHFGLIFDGWRKHFVAILATWIDKSKNKQSF